MTIKLINPKDMVAVTKLPLHLVPDTVGVYAALAYYEGASKYGAYNWRMSPVSFSVYLAALGRHQVKLWNGEWADQVTKVPHLASIIACAGIIADAKLAGTLVDDRPPSVDMAGLIAESEVIIRHLAELFKDYNPVHHTEAGKGESGVPQ